MLKTLYVIDKDDIDITERKAILYGICYNAVLISDQIGIQEFEYVIDGDSQKWGKFVKIGGRLHQIVSPDILDGLIVENYYICIFTKKYNKEIKKYIRDRFNKEFLYVDNPNQLTWGYQSVKELFEKDVYTISKCININIVRDVNTLVSQINEAMKNIDKCPHYYSPIKKGRKVLIKAVCKDEILVIAILSQSSKIPCLESWYGRSTDVRNDEYEFVAYQKNSELSSNITYYSNYNNGLLIQKYCSQKFDFASKDIVRKILNEIKRMHSTTVTVPIKTYPFKRFTSLFFSLDREYQDKLERIKQILQRYEDDFSKSNLVISHGDLHPGNVVFDNNNPIFIDWEYICMTYEWYDVCRFLFYNQIDEFSSDILCYETSILFLYENIEKILLYYDNRISVAQILEAKKMLFLCEAIELCLRLNRHQEGAEHLISKIEKHISIIER